MPQVVQPRAALDTSIDVETPERVHFSFRLAGPSVRLAAYSIDLLVRLAILFVIAWAALMVDDAALAEFSGTGAAIIAIAAFALEWGYFVAAEALTNGQSLGKRLFSLRVIRSDGLPIGWPESLLRNLLRAADFLPFGYATGLMVAMIDPRFRRLGDLAASTLVIVEHKAEILPALKLEPPATAQEREAIPHLPALAASELDAIEIFLRRAASLNVAREEELAEKIAPIFARRLQLSKLFLANVSCSRLLALLYHRCRTERQ